jgi:hypothetical protein
MFSSSFSPFSTSNPHQTGESAFDDLPRQDVPIHHQEISQATVHGTPFAKGKGERKWWKVEQKMEGEAWESTLSSVFVDVSFLSLLDAPLYLFLQLLYLHMSIRFCHFLSESPIRSTLKGWFIGPANHFQSKPQFHVPCFIH